MADKLLKREDIDNKYKWDLSAFLGKDGTFEEQLKELLPKIDKLKEFKGQLSEKAKLLEFFELNSKLSDKLSRLACYAFQKRDENTQDPTSKANYDKINSAYVLISMATSFFNPELAALPEEYVKECIEDPEFSNFDLYLKEVLRVKKHTLSEKEEALLASGGEVFGAFHDIFSMLDDADLKFGKITGEKGEEVELSHSKYGALLTSYDRKVRKDAYETYYQSYKDHIRTIAAIYAGNVKKDIFLSNARGFENCLQRATFNEDADIRAYQNLLKNVESALPSVHEYVSLRKKVLKVDDIRFYDLYVSLVENDSLKVPFEQGYDIVMKALSPLKQDYVDMLKKAKEEGWIDVFPNIGKRSGAYSNSTYGVHPYVLLNYEKTVHDIFTIAHEMGHAMHSYYSNETQVMEKADYTIFVAEVASTVNEVLLLRYLIDNTQDKEMKKFCLNYFLDMFRTTLFRQTMFAEFEYIAHKLAENGNPITSEVLSDEYEKLNKKYYGEEIVHDDFIKYEWARIPHFYRSFYVYKYATGITSAVSIAYDILENGEESVKKYKQFLSSGCTKPPVELLKIAGVDLTCDKPFIAANEVFKKTLEEFKSLMEE